MQLAAQLNEFNIAASWLQQTVVSFYSYLSNNITINYIIRWLQETMNINTRYKFFITFQYNRMSTLNTASILLQLHCMYVIHH